MIKQKTKFKFLITALTIIVNISSGYAQLPVAPALATSNVTEASQYGILYELNIPNTANYASAASVIYAINNSTITGLNYTRVAYFLQLDNKWVWVSMNKFNSTNAELGIPGKNSTINWQQTVSGMNVYSSSGSGVTNTLNATGNIEIWPHCYGQGIGLAGIGGNASTYDFNDSQQPGSNCYGSFQIHNYGASQSILCFNSFNNTNNIDLGIGNQVGGSGHPDWTFAYNAPTFTTKKLFILVNANLSFNSQPSTSSQSLCQNSVPGTLTVSVNTNTLTVSNYKWYSNTLNSNTGGTLVSTVNSSLTTNSFTPSTSTPGTLYYYCMVTATNGYSTTSNPSGAIIVNGSPNININTTSSVLCSGSTLTLSATNTPIKITFTNTGASTWTVPSGITSVSVLVVAGGGGGGGDAAGGGGGGGVVYNSNFTVVPSSTIAVNVGAGGIAGVGTNATLATNGGNSVFGSITAIGGGAGGRYNGNPGSVGGSGGGGAFVNGTGASGTAGQGFSGGNGTGNAGGGGGGAGGAGGNGINGGIGGIGISNSISGSNVFYGGGGGGGRQSLGSEGNSNITSGGGGAGAVSCSGPYALAGTPNTGGGGGGAPVGCQNYGGAGGSGIVIVSYYPAGSSLNSYTWSTGSNSSSIVVTPSITTNYSLTATTSNGCVGNSSVITITVNSTPTISAANGTICLGNNFTITPSGASSYTYSGGSSVVSPSINTTYTITGSNGNCFNTQTISLVVNTNPTVSVSNGTICSGQIYTIQPTGAINYTYSSGTSTVAPSVTTVYSVTGTNAFGCLNTKTLSLLVNSTPTISVNNGAICAGQSFTLTPSGASTYTYSSGSNIVSPSNNTNYTVTGTNSNGCVSVTGAISSVTVNALPVISVNSGAICAGQSFTLTPSGASTYTYSSGSNIVSPSNNTNYTVTGTNSNGCVSATGAISSVTVNALPVISVNSGAICAGQSFTLTPSGASTYTYSSGSNIVSPSVNTNYTVTGTNTNGCVGTTGAISSVTVNALPVISVNSGAICAGQSFTLTPSGASTYTYSSGSNIVSPSNNTNYTVTGTNSNGCVSATGAISSVTVNALPVISVNSGAICAGQSFTLTPSGASTYTYSSGSNIVSPSVNTNYTVTGTNTNGCVGATGAISSVTVNALPVISVNSGAICAGQSFTLTPSGASTYTYSSGSNIVSPSVNTNYTVTGTNTNGCVGTTGAISSLTVNALPVISVNSGAICTGQSFTLTPSGASTYTYSSGSNIVSPSNNTNYTVTGTNSNGCVSAAGAISSVTVNSLPVISVNSGAICAGQSFTLTPNGALTYTYSGGSNIVSPSNNTNYTVTGTNSNGCVGATGAISSVTVNALPVISVNSGVICAGDSFTLIPNGALTYTYSGGSNIVSPSVNTNYTVTGTDNNGCISALGAISSLTVNTLPVISVNSGSICVGGSFTLTPSGALTYTYSGGSNVVTPSVNTSYTVTGTDNNGCSSATAAISSVTVNSLPVISVNSGAICVGDSFTLTPSGALTYTYSGGSNVVTPSVNTNYTVTGTDNNGCVSATAAISSVTVNALPVISVNSGVICAGDSFTLIPNGALTYTYSGGSNIVSPSVNTNYTVTGTDNNGCISALGAISSLTVNALPVISVNSGSICVGDSYTLTPSGALTYTYSGGSNVVTPSVNTNYTVTGTDNNGCSSATAAISSVTVNALPVISVNSGAICAGDSFTLIPNGALTYTFSGGSNIVSPINAGVNSYTISGTDGIGCSSFAIASLTVNSIPNIQVNSGGICPGGVFTIVPTGALTYTFSSITNTVSPSTTTSYTVNGTSSEGCFGSAIVTVTVSSSLIFNTNSGSICIGDSFTITPSGAVSYTYSSGTPIVTPTVNTTYTVTGVDNSGCFGTSISNVTVNPLPILSVNSGSICAGNSFTIIPTGALTYTFSSGNNVVSPLTNTVYSVIGTDINGCLSSQQVTSSVTVNQLPIITVNSGSICTGSGFTIQPSGALTYTYSGGSNIVTPTANTDYTITGTDALGCINSIGAISSVTVNSLPNVSFLPIPNPLCEITTTISLVGSPIGGLFSGIDVNGNDFTPMSVGNYTVSYTYTDANNCTATSNQTVTVNSCTGIKEIDESDIGVYPNPTSDFIIIELNNAMLKSAKLELYDIVGKLLIDEYLTDEKTTFKLNKFKKGMYVVKIKSNNYETIKRIILN